MDATDQEGKQMEELARSIKQRQANEGVQSPKMPESERLPVSRVVGIAESTPRRAVVDDAETESRSRNSVRALNWRNVIKAAGQRYADCRFSNWLVGIGKDAPLRTEVKEMVQEWASTYPERVAERTNLVLYGPVGTGKDHLVFAAVRQAAMQHGAAIHWINGRDLVGEIRDRITLEKTEASLISLIRAPQCVVISDPLPPAGPLSSHQMDMMFRIVHARYSDGKLTVVTLNVADDFEADSHLGVPTWDRLCDRSWKAYCDWDSHRKPAKVVMRKKK